MTRNRLLFVILILVCWTTTALATPVELIENGNFDQGLQGWSTFGDARVKSAGPYASYLGMEDNYALLGGTGWNGLTALWQPFSIQGLDQITLSFDWAFPYIDITPFQEDTFLSFIQQDGTPLMKIGLMDLRSDGIDLTNHGSFQQTIDISSFTSDDALLVFQLWEAPGWTDSAVGIDNVSLRGNAPVPEPATLLLFGTGLAGLVGWRSRKHKDRTRGNR